MKNHKFSLESVLQIRSNKEKEVLEEFVIIQNRLYEEYRKKEDLEKELNLYLKAGTYSRNIQELMMRNLYKTDLESKIKFQDEIIDRRKIEVEEVREKLQIAQKDKKIMEKLKEKDLENYILELNKKNQKEMDEFAVLRFKQS